jgi:NitT/TauT family transport system substrate-binding protein
MLRFVTSAGRLLPTAVLVTTLTLATFWSAAAQAEGEGEGAAEAVPLTVGLGYIPSVQFAQFYLAQEAGYYDDAGLAVTFENKIDPELITLLARGAVDIGMSDGTSVIPAVSQGIPVRYGATIYGRDPNVVFSLAETGIDSAADLAGASIGIPGRYGSSWVALQALLLSEGLAPEDARITTYPDFGQAVAVAAGQVDAATGFATNEPIQLGLQGLDVNVLRVADVAPLPGPGLVAGTVTIERKGEALRAFTAATIRAMEEITADPVLGLEATFARVPELSADPATQLAILEATIDSWMGDYAAVHGLGAVDRAAWDSGLEIMRSLPDSTVSDELTVDDLVTDALGS